MSRCYTQFALADRRRLYHLVAANIPVNEMARQLGRHRSTIFREIKRNMFVDKTVPDLNGYYCVTAHDMACERRAKLRKLMRFSHIRQSVIERIMYGWSPQQIAGRMRQERHPISVSHETIYKFAYPSDGQAIKLSREVDPLSVTDADLVEICNHLNATPRKCLGYRTPAEVFRKKLPARMRHAG